MSRGASTRLPGGPDSSGRRRGWILAVVLLAVVSALALAQRRHASRAAGTPPAPAPAVAGGTGTAAAPSVRHEITRDDILNTVASEIAPPENAYENELTPESDPKGVIEREEKLAAEHNEVYRQSAKAQHDLVAAVRKVYEEKPEIRLHNERIKELQGVMRDLRKNSAAYQEALQASLAARQSYRDDQSALVAMLTNAAVDVAAAVAAPPTPDRFELQVRVAAEKEAYEEACRKLAGAEEALRSDPAWTSAQEETVRLQKTVRELLSQDATVRDLKQRGEDLERRKRELTKERLKEQGGSAS
jgi:hypothetical protein